MKAFEEWWLLEAQNIVGVGRATEEDVAEITWKTALEWVLKDVCSVDHGGIDRVARDIEKELE